MPYGALSKARHPFEIFTLFLAFITGIPLIFGDAKPGSISSQLNSPIAENVWAILLSLGAGIALCGVLWVNRVNGILIEQVGLAMTGLSVIFYTIVVSIAATGWGSTLPVVLILSFGLSCCVRYIQLEKIIRSARKDPKLLTARDKELL